MTDSEREWLEDREWFRHPYTCKWCDRYDPLLFFPANKSIPCKWYQSCTSLNCPSQSDLLDALEFSERVVVKLANIHFGTEDCPYCSNHINVNEYCGECKTASTDRKCLACRLKYARLKVEEEINEQSQN